MIQCRVPSARVVPTLDPGEDRRLRFGLAPPGAPGDQLALQRGKEALGHRVVVGIAHRAHRRAHAHLLAATAEGHAGVLGGFNPSLQHLLVGGVDEVEELEVESITAREATLTGAPADVASSTAMAVLEGDRPRVFK